MKHALTQMQYIFAVIFETPSTDAKKLSITDTFLNNTDGKREKYLTKMKVALFRIIILYTVLWGSLAAAKYLINYSLESNMSL